MNKTLNNIIEALIFVSLEPLPLEKIKEILKEFSDEDIEKAAQKLVLDYSEGKRGIHIHQASGGYLFATRKEYNEYVKRLMRDEKRKKLSREALETLSAVAYHQPITLAEISAIRGVDATHCLKTLLEKKLIKIVGRKKSPGKPLIYRTSKEFLAYFGLNSIEDLPSKEEIEKILEDKDEEH
ncbi:MAG: SMC-Scp complex subunit ScpB [Candidatus Aminicenantes bacterium]|nr:SMC-Scp complex subunit ScpB [Candidatus Aminicenantes bacterium]